MKRIEFPVVSPSAEPELPSPQRHFLLRVAQDSTALNGQYPAGSYLVCRKVPNWGDLRHLLTEGETVVLRLDQNTHWFLGDVRWHNNRLHLLRRGTPAPVEIDLARLTQAGVVIGVYVPAEIAATGLEPVTRGL